MKGDNQLHQLVVAAGHPVDLSIMHTDEDLQAAVLEFARSLSAVDRRRLGGRP